LKKKKIKIIVVPSWCLMQQDAQGKIEEAERKPLPGKGIAPRSAGGKVWDY